jgi:organic hydroperoxide reductase OsmC/OhrA
MNPETPEVESEARREDITITMEQIRDYEFRVKFDKEQYPDLLLDEPPPVGHDTGPNPSRLLAAAAGNCLSASFLFSARKMRVNIQSLRTTVKVWYTRNEKGRLRIGKMKVAMAPKFDPADASKIQRCLELFEDYCVVTQSIRNGIDVSVAMDSP